MVVNETWRRSVYDCTLRVRVKQLYGGGSLNVVVRFKVGDELSSAQDGTGYKRHWKPPYILELAGQSV